MKRDNNQTVFDIHTPIPRYPVMKEIQKRFSPRFFAKNPVKKDDLNSIMEAARWAPSGHNHQPWFYFTAKKGTKAYTNIFSTLSTYNQSWAYTAPLLILACAIIKNEHGKNPFAVYDLGASVMSLVLQAQSLGYYARQMGMFDKQKVKSMVQMEKYTEPFVIIALGSIGDFSHAPKEIMEFERDARPRKTNISQKLLHQTQSDNSDNNQISCYKIV